MVHSQSKHHYRSCKYSLHSNLITFKNNLKTICGPEHKLNHLLHPKQITPSLRWTLGTTKTICNALISQQPLQEVFCHPCSFKLPVVHENRLHFIVTRSLYLVSNYLTLYCNCFLALFSSHSPAKKQKQTNLPCTQYPRCFSLVRELTLYGTARSWPVLWGCECSTSAGCQVSLRSPVPALYI